MGRILCIACRAYKALSVTSCCLAYYGELRKVLSTFPLATNRGVTLAVAFALWTNLNCGRYRLRFCIVDKVELREVQIRLSRSRTGWQAVGRNRAESQSSADWKNQK